ncbi:MAG: hypothetical protein BRD49_04395 [Bacteroidetes bacterium SW_10_40_5]|nr:MAG: hypothetical protein BRD49_04395 [Bacteroidetes bacterium SW_10_40_5]
MGGYWLVYHSKVETIRGQVEQKLKQEEQEATLTRIAIPKNHDLDRSTFKKVHETEFWYKGKLYDVVESKVKSDSIVYRAYHDCAEEQVHQGLQALLQAYEEAEKSKNNTQEVKLTIKNWFHQTSNFNLSNPYWIIDRLDLRSQYKEPAIRSLKRPPLVCFLLKTTS